jgi:hypothetical protein
MSGVENGGAIASLPHTTSWLSAESIKHEDNFTFTLMTFQILIWDQTYTPPTWILGYFYLLMNEELEVLTFPNKDWKETWYWYIVTVPTDACVMTLCSLVWNAASIHFNVKDEGSTFLQKVGTYLQD